MMWSDRLNVSWNTGFNSRIYDETAYVDYKNMYTGFDIGYERPERFEWKLSPALEKSNSEIITSKTKLILFAIGKTGAAFCRV